MQGIYINGRRPKSKEEVRRHINGFYDEETNPVERMLNSGRSTLDMVHIEATSFFGNEYDGALSQMPQSNTVYFVGPDPHTKRNFYGAIKWDSKKNRWIVQ